MHPATRESKQIASSNLKLWFSEALSEFQAFTEFLSSITAEDLHGFWGRRKQPHHLALLYSDAFVKLIRKKDARSQLVSCSNFLIYLFLMASEKKDVERSYGLLEDFVTAAQALTAVATVEANIFLRPASMRIESFFTQAAQIMRHGQEAPLP
jgi:NCS1 family nucleobase:cation symporter-1